MPRFKTTAPKLSKAEAAKLSEALYSIPEAAELLRMRLDTFRYHLYSAGNLKPDYKLSGRLVFRHTTLEAFRSAHMAGADDDLSMADAAKFLGLSANQFRYLVSQQKAIRPDGRRGNAFTFKRSKLLTFKALIDAGHKPFDAGLLASTLRGAEVTTKKDDSGRPIHLITFQAAGGR